MSLNGVEIKDHEHGFLVIGERKAGMGKRPLNLSDQLTAVVVAWKEKSQSLNEELSQLKNNLHFHYSNPESIEGCGDSKKPQKQTKFNQPSQER